MKQMSLRRSVMPHVQFICKSIRPGLGARGQKNHCTQNFSLFFFEFGNLMSFQGNREFAAATVTPFRDQTNEVIYSRATHNSVHRMQPEQGVHTQHRCHRQGASCPSNLQCVCEYDADRRLTNKPRLSATSLCHLFFSFLVRKQSNSAACLLC